MIEKDETIIRWALEMLLGLSCLTVMLVALSLLVRTKERRQSGNFCGHCGEILPLEPSRAVLFTENACHVYTCRRCKRETMLPSP